MTTIVILQPGYLPWLGFFDQMLRSNIFVYYDDVQYDKHGWRNRNRIKSAEGPTWLTVPVLNSGRHGQRICDVAIDNRSPWARKHVKTIAQSYAKAPHLTSYLPQLEKLLLRDWESLVELDLATVALMCKWLGIEKQIVRSSLLGITGNQSRRLLDICKRFGAECYLSGDSAQDYLDQSLFSQEGVQIEWQSYKHPAYRQLHGEFVPYLSALDLILNLGPESLNVLKRKP